MVTTGRKLHGYIRRQIELAMGWRSWNWLAGQTGIPSSTLCSERKKPKFSLEVVLLVAQALDRDLSYFLPPDAPIDAGGNGTVARLVQLEKLLEEWRQSD